MTARTLGVVGRCFLGDDGGVDAGDITSGPSDDPNIGIAVDDGMVIIDDDCGWPALWRP